MKKIIIIILLFPFFAKAQVPTLSLDTTYKARANQTGVLVVTDAAYFPKLANADSTLFAQFDQYGKLIFRKVTSGTTGTPFDSTSLSYRINLKVNTSDTSAMLLAYRNAINSKVNYTDTAAMLAAYRAGINTNAAAIATKLNITDTANIRLRAIAGTNTTITGTYPNITFNSTAGGTGTVTNVATGLGLLGGAITTTGTLIVDTSSASILSRQRAAATYQPTITLTTTGTSGASTLVGSALNIPNYATGGGGAIYTGATPIVVTGSVISADTSKSAGKLATFTDVQSATNAWKLIGNVGTDTSVNFIGTTDAKAFRVKVNNKNAITIDTVGRVSILGSNNVGYSLSSPDFITGNIRAFAGIGADARLTAGTGFNVFGGTSSLQGTVAIGFNGAIGGATPFQDASAQLELRSTTQGVLLPRMTTTQILAIATPANGLTLYNITLNTLCFYNGTTWQRVTTTAM